MLRTIIFAAALAAPTSALADFSGPYIGGTVGVGAGSFGNTQDSAFVFVGEGEGSFAGTTTAAFIGFRTGTDLLYGGEFAYDTANFTGDDNCGGGSVSNCEYEADGLISARFTVGFPSGDNFLTTTSVGLTQTENTATVSDLGGTATSTTTVYGANLGISFDYAVTSFLHLRLASQTYLFTPVDFNLGGQIVEIESVISTLDVGVVLQF